MGRAAYIRKRLILMAFVLFGVTVVIFGMVRILPGDPAFLILGDRATDQKAAELREQLGLNRPAPEQYWMFVSGFARGDMGQSLLYRHPGGDQQGALARSADPGRVPVRADHTEFLVRHPADPAARPHAPLVPGGRVWRNPGAARLVSLPARADVGSAALGRAYPQPARPDHPD